MKKFLNSMLSIDPKVSSKRTAGCFGWFLVCTLVSIIVLFDVNIDDRDESLINTVAYASVTLIAGGTIANVISKKQKVQ